MDISDFAEDYLVDVPIEIGTLSPQVKDHKDGMRKLTAWLLNEVMQQEALNQIQAQPLNAHSREERAVMVQESDLSKPFTAM